MNVFHNSIVLKKLIDSLNGNKVNHEILRGIIDFLPEEKWKDGFTIYEISLERYVTTICGQILLMYSKNSGDRLIADSSYICLLQKSTKLTIGFFIYSILVFASNLGLDVNYMLSRLNSDYEKEISGFKILISELRTSGFKGFQLEYLVIIAVFEIAIDFDFQLYTQKNGHNDVIDKLSSEKFIENLNMLVYMFTRVDFKEIEVLVENNSSVFEDGSMSSSLIEPIIKALKNLIVVEPFKDEIVYSKQGLRSFFNTIESIERESISKNNVSIPLGFISPGNSPQIIDSTLTFNKDLDSTVIHESSHYRFFSNTVIGYLLTRLNDIKELGEFEEFHAKFYASQSEQMPLMAIYSNRKYYFEFIYNRSVSLIEGHALAQEIIHRGNFKNDIAFTKDYTDFVYPFKSIINILSENFSRQELSLIIDALCFYIVDIPFVWGKIKYMELADLVRIVEEYSIHKDASLYLLYNMDIWNNDSTRRIKGILDDNTSKEKKYKALINLVHDMFLLSPFCDDKLKTTDHYWHLFDVIPELDKNLNYRFPINPLKIFNRNVFSATSSLVRSNPKEYLKVEIFSLKQFETELQKLLSENNVIYSPVSVIWMNKKIIIDHVNVIKEGETVVLGKRNLRVENVSIEDLQRLEATFPTIIWMFPLFIRRKAELPGQGFKNEISDTYLSNEFIFNELESNVFFYKFSNDHLDLDELVLLFGIKPAIRLFYVPNEPDTVVVTLEFGRLKLILDINEAIWQTYYWPKELIKDKCNLLEDIPVACVYLRIRTMFNPNNL
ncbi:MAG: hypothetical protein Sapg2KO_50270 [Saprospiraceae bacterium]